MASRARDWFEQGLRDLDHADASRDSGSHEWACFAAQQGAEKLVKALHLHLGQEAWGHVVARLLAELPDEIAPPDDLVQGGRVLDTSRRATRTATRRGRRSSTTARCRARRRCDMPERSRRSSVVTWPDPATVDAAVREWARGVAEQHPAVDRIGYFGSYATGDWGVGSDVDLVVIVSSTEEPFERRGVAFDATRLPVPADILVYTVGEWRRLTSEPGFARTAHHQMVWVLAG